MIPPKEKNGDSKRRVEREIGNQLSLVTFEIGIHSHELYELITLLSLMFLLHCSLQAVHCSATKKINVYEKVNKCFTGNRVTLLGSESEPPKDFI